MEKIEKKVRKPAVAGYFYPNEQNELKKELEFYLNSINSTAEINRIYGLISPHAGYVYSGKTAAFGYSELKGRSFRTVIILAPSHRDYFKGACIYNGTAYSTPLGQLEIDHSITEKIINKCNLVFLGSKGHNDEHSLEVQLPFLQSVLNDFKIVPIVLCDIGLEQINKFAEVLSEVIDDETLIVASSDLSHFYSSQVAEILDNKVAELIESYNADGLYFAAAKKEIEACGILPIVTLMKTLSFRGVKNASVLFRNNSGDISGDYSEVVGYLSAVFYS